MSNDIQLELTDGGVILPVAARPGAKKNGVTGTHDGALKVSVTQVPEKGKANGALIQVLAKALGLKKSQVQLVSGQTSTRKKFQISGVDCATLRERIDRVL